MIDERQVDNIKKYGVFMHSGEPRFKVLKEDIGFTMDQRAEYVIIGGCFQPEAMSHVFKALKKLLEHLEVDYTLLSKEYCCGWMPIGQPAVMTKNEEDIAKFKELSKGFIMENFKQAESLGANSIVLFCAACEPNYSNFKDAAKLEIISYTELLDRYFKDGSLDLALDYYPGCYRFRRRITHVPLDTEPAVRLLKRIKGLKVNSLDSELCCYKPLHLEQIINNIKSNNLLTICTGCYHNLKASLQNNENLRIRMLPELLIEAI
jgi:Fe-S oxidoreductase